MDGPTLLAGNGDDETCPGCGVELPMRTDPAHPYFGASPSCWALYGVVLAREYGDPALMGVHRLTVDAYAAQHPGVPGRRSTQSVWAHLAGLYLGVERGLVPGFIRRVMAELTHEAEQLAWLSPPATLGTITVGEVAAVPDNAAHEQIVQQWARDVWAAWGEHHEAVARLADRTAARL